MGLLLMQYEYQKAKQKVNLYELRGIRLNDMSERYAKRIADIEKLFNKKQSSLESQFSTFQSQLNSKIQMASATGSFDINIGSIFTGFGIGNAPAITSLQTALGTAVAGLGNDANGNALSTQQEIAAQRASLASQLQSVLQVTLNALKEAALAELEAAEDRQREPIAAKDAEIQADVAENDTLLTLAEERKEAAKNRLPNVIKDSVAHYGLS